MSTTTNNQLLDGGVARSLIAFTIPIVFALALQVMYGTIDMFIVGNFASIEDVSGVSTGSQLINTITTLCIGMAMGSTILLGQKIGQRRESEVEEVISNSLVLFIGVSLFTMVLLLLFHDEILNGLNTPDDAWQQTSDYILYGSIGIPLIFVYNVLGSIFRGLGDSKTPLMAVGIACVANIVGDMIFVAYCGMGAKGAALATILAQGISVVASLYIVKWRNSFVYKIRLNLRGINLDYIKRVIALGFPIALQSGLTSLSFLFIALIVNKLGVLFSASVGITEKLTGVIMLLPIAFMQSISVFVAQNYGANNFERAKSGFKVGLFISAVFGFMTASYSFFWGENLIWLFNRDAEVIATAATYLKVYSFDVAFVPFLFCLIGYLNGCGKSVYVMIQGVIGAIAIRLCLTYYMSTIEPVTLIKIGLATPLATTFQTLMCIYFYRRTQRSHLE